MVAALAGGALDVHRMGGVPGSLADAFNYSNMVFGGALLVWILNSLAA